MRKRLLCMFMALTILLGSMDITAMATALNDEDVMSDNAQAKAEDAITDDIGEVIEVGDYILLGKYNDLPILWRCIDIDENGPLIISDKIISFKPFDAAGVPLEGNSHARQNSASRHKRQARGSNFWADSNIRDWLNSTAGEGEVIYTCGNPPASNRVYFGCNNYANEKGFLSPDNFSDNELCLIKEVTQKFILNEVDVEMADGGNAGHDEGLMIDNCFTNYDDAYYMNSTERIFLPSIKQVYNMYQRFGSYYIGYPTEEIAAKPEYESLGIAADKTWKYWLRDSMWNGFVSTHARFVNPDGEMQFCWAYDDHCVGIRPAFYFAANNVESRTGDGSMENPFVYEVRTFEAPDRPWEDVEVSGRTIIEAVERYTSGEEIKEVQDIMNSSFSNEQKRQMLFEYYNYDNMLDVRERLVELSAMHDERWDYEGLIRDDMYLAWQYYYYLNHTALGAGARTALYLSGLAFNNELSEWIDPSTYLDGDYPGVKKYKSMLEEFIHTQNKENEYYSYITQTEKFINSSVGIWSNVEKGDVIKSLKKAPDAKSCQTLFNNFIVEKNGRI